jgi:hypothetical protein
MKSISRRQLFRSGGSLAVAAAATAAEQNNQAAKTPPAPTKEPLLLEARFIEKMMDGNRVKLRSFNG